MTQLMKETIRRILINIFRAFEDALGSCFADQTLLTLSSDKHTTYFFLVPMYHTLSVLILTLLYDTQTDLFNIIVQDSLDFFPAAGMSLKENKCILGTVVATLPSERNYVYIEKPIFISLLVPNSIMSM